IPDNQDCAPNDATKPAQGGTDANCNGVIDSQEDSDGDGIPNGQDCAPNDATKPAKGGPDANCDGVVDDTTPPTMIISTAPVTMTGKGFVGVKLTCPASEPGGCTGGIALDTAKAVAT